MTKVQFTVAEISDLPYRPGVGILLLNEKGQVFVAQRIDTRAEAWQMPQGGIDNGESPEAAALRELEEEIGTAKAEIIATSQDWVYYDLPIDIVPKVWEGRFRGQKQMWFAMRFLGEDSDINIATENPEFHEWRWAEIDELPELIVPFKRSLYEELVRQFKPIVLEATRKIS